MVFLQTHDRHGLGLILLDLLGNRNSKLLNSTLAADGRHCVARFHVLVRTGNALQRHADLRFPTTLGVGRCCFHLWQRLGYRHHFLTQHFTLAPRDVAVNERERIDRPSCIILDFSLVSTEHPVTGLVHLDDDRTRWADFGFERAQCGGKGRNGRQVSAFEINDIGHYCTPIGF